MFPQLSAKEGFPVIRVICHESFIYVTGRVSHRSVACVAGAKREGERGREKSAKEGRRENSACYKSRCFCIPPTIF